VSGRCELSCNRGADVSCADDTDFHVISFQLLFAD
jgi:hypothetical protein